jgi:hypothetical protein
MARAEKAKPAPVTPARLREVLGAYWYAHTSERDLQDGLAQVLALRGIRFDREVRLSPEDRPDFMVDGIAVEVKVDGSLSDVTRQLHRYTAHKPVRAVLLVTSLQRLANLPGSMNGKPVAVLALLGGIR